MDLKDIDLSKLRYDPSNKKDLKRLQEDHPDAFGIEHYENPKLHKFHNEIMRYIILVYDMRSPLIQSIKEHNERKVRSLLMAGFESNNLGRFDTDIESSLLYGKDQGVARMIVKYVYIFNNIDYSELVGMIEINSQILRDIMNAKRTKDTMKQLSDTSARIKELTANVFGGKETKEIEEQLYEQLNMSRLSFRPERIAQRIHLGKTEDMYMRDIYSRRRKKKDE
jgi:hypothetical protein